MIEDGEATLYARPRSSRDTDEFFRDRQYGELWVGRRPSAHEISTSLGLPVRHVDDLPAALCRLRQDPRAPRRLRPGRPPGGRGRHPRRGLRPGGLRDAPGQGRVGGRRAAGGLRHHHPRLRGLGPRVGRRAEVRRALDRGHLLPSRPRDGQRHRLRLDRRRRHARHHAALDRERRPDHPRRAGPARHGRRGPQPLHRRRHPHAARSTAGSPTCSASSTTSCTTRRRPGIQAVRPGVPLPRRARRRDERPRPRPRGHGPAAGVGRGGAGPGQQGLRALDAARHQPHARHGRPRLRQRRAPTSTPRATWPRAWC